MAHLQEPSPAPRYRRNPAVEEAPLQGELMVYDPAGARFFVLNPTMAYVWRRCDGEHTLERMLGDLPSHFAGVERAAAEQDLGKALEELASLGLVLP